jgi:hypothetical protein
VVIKPWKLVFRGNALYPLKSSEFFSGLLMSMLSSEPENSEHRSEPFKESKPQRNKCAHQLYLRKNNEQRVAENVS